MATDAEDIVLQLTGDTKQFERSIRSALGIVKGVTSDMVAAFERAGVSMDGAGTKATKLQKQIEALTGVKGGMADRAADIEAYGAQLDALRAKYNPLFAAQQQYVKSLADINQAAKVGALSEKERVAAIAKTKSAFSDQVKSLKSSGAANTELAETGKLARYEMINLSRQIQDVGVSLVSGQSPFIVLTQQGTQIADIFGSSKTASVGGAIKQIGSGIASVITPMRLLGVGVAAAGVAAYASYESWKKYTLALDDTAKSVGTTTSSLSKLQAAASFKGISADDFTKGIQTFGQNVYEAKNNMGSLADVFRVNNVHASDFDDYLAKAADIIKRAGTDQQKLVLLQQMGLPATMQWVRLLSGGADGLNAAKKAAAEFAANDDLVKSARDFDEKWNAAWTNFSLNARSAFQKALDGGSSFFDKMDSLAKQAGNASFWTGLANFTGSLGLNSKPAGVETLTSFSQRFAGSSSNTVSSNGALAAALAKKAASLAGPPAEDPNVVKDRIAKEQQYLGLLGQTTTAAEARRQVELQYQAAAANGVKVDWSRLDVLKKLAEESILGITAIKQQADSYRIESSTIGMSVGQATAYAAAQNALNDARRNGRALTAQNIADINKEAEALGKAAQAAAQLKLASDIKFDRSQIGLSDSEQAANSKVRSVFGDDVNSAQAQFYKQQLLINDALKQYSDVSKDATKGFIQDIISGKSAVESLSGALTKIGNKLIDMAVDGLWSKAFGGIGSSFLSTLLGGGGPTGTISVGSQTFPKFAGGTNFAPGGLALVGEKGPELVNLPRGSAVTPNHKLAGAMGTSVTVGGSTVVIQGDASANTIALIKQALAAHDAALPSKVVAAVTDARKRRQLT